MPWTLNTLPRVSKIIILLGLNYTTCGSPFHYARKSMEGGSMEGHEGMDAHCQLVENGVSTINIMSFNELNYEKD